VFQPGDIGSMVQFASDSLLGEPPAQIVWEGDSGGADGSGDENPYRDDPVVWTNDG